MPHPINSLLPNYFPSSTSSIFFPSNHFRTLELSCRSFQGSRPLFSMPCGLFLQNARCGIPPSEALGSSVLRCSPIPDPSSITFRINTCKSVSKQMTLTPFRINTYEKRGEGGRSLLPPPSHAPRSASIPLRPQPFAHTSRRPRGVPLPPLRLCGLCGAISFCLGSKETLRCRREASKCCSGAKR